jgi:hypothetical protein
MKNKLRIFVSGNLIFFAFFILDQIPSFAQAPVEQTAKESAAPKGGDNSLAPAQGGAGSEEEKNFLTDIQDPFISSLPLKSVVVSQSEAAAIRPTTETGPNEKFDYSSLKVSGLVWGAEKPRAIIDEKVVGIGDTIKEAKILNISKEGILFNYRGKQYLMEREGTRTSQKVQEAR